MKTEELASTWTITVKMTVFAGDMSKAEVIGEAERLLPDLVDGSDFSGVYVTNAERDEI